MKIRSEYKIQYIDIHDLDKINQGIINIYRTITGSFRFKYQVISNSKLIKYDDEEVGNDEIIDRLISTSMNRPQIKEDLFNKDHSGDVDKKVQNLEMVGSNWIFQGIVAGNSCINLPIKSAAFQKLKNNDT